MPSLPLTPRRPRTAPLLAPTVATALLLAVAAPSAHAFQAARAIVYRIPVEGVSLHARLIGQGEPLVVLHGGPDLDSGYLIPELDRLQDSFRLLYYDQRGRGRSAERVAPGDVSIASDIEDLDRVRQHLRVESMALLGHDWGAVLALEYARRYPTRVSQLILMNPGPVPSPGGGSAAVEAGDPDSVAAHLRTRFPAAPAREAEYERLMARLRAALLVQGREGILKARAVAARLLQATWERPDYDLLPTLGELRVPTVVITGNQDAVPGAFAERVAHAMPNALLVNVPGCGHFAYMECAEEARRAIAAVARRAAPIEFPDLLRFDAVDRKCVPVLDTLAFPGLQTPLWRYGVYEEGADTLRKASAAYWCSMSSGLSETAIVVWRHEYRETPLPGGCDRVIPYRGRPGGLRFERRGAVPLRDAFPVDEPSRRGPPITARGVVIIAEHEGRTARFVCHTGRWWVLQGTAP